MVDFRFPGVTTFPGPGPVLTQQLLGKVFQPQPVGPSPNDLAAMLRSAMPLPATPAPAPVQGPLAPAGGALPSAPPAGPASQPLPVRALAPLPQMPSLPDYQPPPQPARTSLDPVLASLAEGEAAQGAGYEQILASLASDRGMVQGRTPEEIKRERQMSLLQAVAAGIGDLEEGNYGAAILKAGLAAAMGHNEINQSIDSEEEELERERNAYEREEAQVRLQQVAANTQSALQRAGVMMQDAQLGQEAWMNAFNANNAAFETRANNAFREAQFGLQARDSALQEEGLNLQREGLGLERMRTEAAIEEGRRPSPMVVNNRVFMHNPVTGDMTLKEFDMGDAYDNWSAGMTNLAVDELQGGLNSILDEVEAGNMDTADMMGNLGMIAALMDEGGTMSLIQNARGGTNEVRDITERVNKAVELIPLDSPMRERARTMALASELEMFFIRNPELAVGHVSEILRRQARRGAISVPRQ